MTNSESIKKVCEFIEDDKNNIKNDKNKINYSNCFAYHKSGQCSALKETICKSKKKCPFYKTQSEYVKGQESSKQRLLRMGRILTE